jgi:flagellar M-ring protein FliF
MEKIQQQIIAFLKGLSTRQRIVLGGSVVLVAGTIWLFVKLLDAGEYKPLYTGMAPTDAQQLGQRLAEKNIAYQLTSDGTGVMVRSDQLDKARMETAAQGLLASGRMGFELFDKPNWSGSDFSEKVNYQRALEAELERTIQTMNGVDGVRVHLVLPRESLFAERERPAKAAVVLKMHGTRLTDAVATSVVNLVSSAWDDLSPSNVTVVTTEGQIPAEGHGHNSVMMAGNQELETALAERVVQTLGPVVGPDHVKSSITIDYDQTSGESTQELYDPANAAVLSSQTSEETAGDLTPQGVPGTTSNTPAATPAPAANAANPAAGTATQTKISTTTQGIHTETKTFAVSKTTHRTLEPAGRIRKMAAAILVDDVVETKADAGGKIVETRRKRTPEEMKQIENLAKAAVGFNMQRGDDFSLENISFLMPTIEVLPPPGKIQKFVGYAERWAGLLRYAGLFALFLVVYFLLLRPVKKQVLHILQAPGGGSAAAGTTAAAGTAAAALPASVTGLLPDAGGELPEVTQAMALKKELVQRVKDDPRAAGRVIETWMREA